MNATDIFAASLKRAADAHHIYESMLGTPDPNWQRWYAAFMVADPSVARILVTYSPTAGGVVSF